MVSEYATAIRCGYESWSGFWGDPLFSGTLMMVTYSAATVMAWRASRGLSGMERGAWGMAAVLMAFQVLNTPLDLHGLAWAVGRCLAHIEGWYDARHAYQRDLLVLLALIACGLFGLSILMLWRDLLTNMLMVVGLGLSVGMTIVKGVNYHDLEMFYAAAIGPLRVPEVVELLGIAGVLVAAFLKRRPRALV